MKTKNPLRKRLPREIRKDFKKYLALFLLLTITIGAVAAIYVANDSMEAALADGYRLYNIEDGHFELKDKPAEELLDTFRDAGITLYEQCYRDFDEDADGDNEPDAVIRVFKNREDINRACIISGRLPEKAGEIAIDRMHADNSGITIGSSISLNGKELEVVGLVAFSDYSTLYKSNMDTMFDALTFNIGVVTPEQYDVLDAPEVYQYAFKYASSPSDDNEQKEMSDALVKKLGTLAATGGMLDDPDEAEELSDRIDEWTALIDDVKAKGDVLTEKKDVLEAEADALEAEGDKLKEEGEKLEAEGAELAQKQQRLMTSIGPMLVQMGVMPGAGADENAAAGTALQLDEDTISQLLPYLPESTQAEVRDLMSEGEDLEKRADELKTRGDELQAKADDLQARGDALQAEADELQPLIDEAEAAGDELKKLEPYEDLQNEVTDYVPEYLNQAIHFAPDDMGSDKSMCEVLLIVLVIVLAFVFAITASNTIVNEANVIGTLRASGYTKSELLRHYITLPMVVTFAAAVIGNILGYSVLKNVVVMMYYNSYSLPTYVTRWNADAFMRTTIIPVVIMVVVNYIVLKIKLRFSPLQFLRRDLSNKKNRRALRIPNFRFMTRFRIRVLLQNIPGYLVLFAGIAFVDVLLGFAIGLPATLGNYQDHVTDYLLVDYQYVLKGTEDEDGNEIATSEPTAEKYSITNLETTTDPHIGEKITVYGYVDGSRYFDIAEKPAKGEVYVSDAFAEKFSLRAGQNLVLKEEYSDKTYDFIIKGMYDLPGTLAILLPNDEFNSVFDLDEGSFTGYLAENEIKDIDKDMIATVVTLDDALKISNQLDHSMGSFMGYFKVICVIMAVIIIYVLTKIIIERSAVSISMVKVLGYTNKEINSLYIRITSIVVFVSAVVGTFICRGVLVAMWANVMYRLNGWFKFYIGVNDTVEMVIMVLIAYFIVVFFDMRRIRRIPMTEALKNVE